MNEAIILCGGNGKRIRSITEDKIPKSLVEIQGISILERQINWLVKNGIEKIVLAVGHRSSAIKKVFSDFPDAEIVISEDSPSGSPGTSGALKTSLEKISSDSAVMLYGDILTDFDLSKMIQIHQDSYYLVSVMVHPLQSRYGIIEFAFNRKIISFEEKPLLPHFISGGVFIINKSIANALPKRGAFETTLLPKLVKMELVSAYTPEDYNWISIETEKDYDNAQKLFIHSIQT